MIKGKGGLDVLETVELPLEPPKPGQLRIKVTASGAGFTDITMRTSKYLFAPPWPYVAGYEVLGIVDALGDGVSGFSLGQRVCALTVFGAWAEYFTREADHFVPVPDGVDDGEAVAMILNYITAYQMIHRFAKMQAGQTALVSGANGGVGTALLELLKIHGVRALGACSKQHFDYVRSLGGEPIESRVKPLDVAVHEVLPEGVDAAFDGLGGSSAREHIRATKKGGFVVGYGFMQARGSFFGGIRGILVAKLGARLSGRRGDFYGITAIYRKDKRPLKEDLPKLFALLKEKKLHPKIAARLPLLDGKKAEEMLEKGGVNGKIVLVA
jgi:NADPH:quinone reductase-like Zn-dependent oxidoreductase